MRTPLWAWASTVGLIAVVVVVDMLVFHRTPRPVGFREAAGWSGLWVGLAVLFGAVLWIGRGADAAAGYYAAYIIEKSLSVDNIFVLAVILTTFAVPAGLQHRLLNWGVLGALCCRGGFIALGVAALDAFGPLLYVLGAFLVVAGTRMAIRSKHHADPNRNPVVRLVRRVLPLTDRYHGTRLVLRSNGRLHATPLLAALVTVETTDLVFAADSIPAVLSVSNDPFIVFVSNAFAMLGLRAMYFLLSGMLGRFSLLRAGLAAVVVFVGIKMIAADVVHLPVALSLAVILSIVAASVIASLRKGRSTPEPDVEPADPHCREVSQDATRSHS
jgi:tellurite resistance protein TerC